MSDPWTRERDGACGRCRGAEALLAMEKTFAPSMEGHLTKHWDGDDKVGGAHQAVTDETDGNRTLVNHNHSSLVLVLGYSSST